MDIRLPNGVVLNNIPDGMPPREIKRQAIAHGIAKEEDFGGPVAEQRPAMSFSPTDYSQQNLSGTDEANQKASADILPSKGDIVNEGKRVSVGGTLLPIIQTLLSFGNAMKEGEAGGKLTFDPAEKARFEEQKAAQQRSLANYLRIITGDKSLRIDEKTGRAVADTPKTIAGQVLPYLVAGGVGTKFLQSSELLAGLSPEVRTFVAANVSNAVGTQFLSDPYADNMANYLEKTLDNGHAKDVVRFLANKEDDSELTRRMHMLGQDLVFTTGFATVGGLAKLGKSGGSYLYNKYLKSGPESFTKQEAGDFFVEQLNAVKEQRNMMNEHHLDGTVTPQGSTANFELDGTVDPSKLNSTIATPTAESAVTQPTKATPSQPQTGSMNNFLLEDTVDVKPAVSAEETTAKNKLLDSELNQIMMQNGTGFGAAFNRMINQTVKSRGYWTDTLFKLKSESLYNQKAIALKANNIANRLSKAMDTVALEATDPKAAMPDISDRVSKALAGDQEVFNALPRPIQVELGYARTMIDDMSNLLIDSPTIHQEFKDDIEKNLGKYVKTSYKAYTDAKFVPNPVFQDEFLQKETQNIMEADPSIPLEKAQAHAKANMDVLLDKTGNGFNRYFTETTKLNNSIYSRKKDIPEHVTNLLETITNPADNIILTAKKLANYTENDKFTRGFFELGKDAFVTSDKKPIGILTKEITGTNSILDGQYTTEELLTALKGRQSMIFDPSGDTLWDASMRNLAFIKGVSKASKTVFSAGGHFKNSVGAIIMRSANGTNPFKGLSEALAVAKNDINRTGNKVYDDMAEEYARLGITSSGVRSQEISELLEIATNNPSAAPSKLAELASNAFDKLPKKYQDRFNIPREIYGATDDIVKIAQYEDELATLKKAYPERDLQELKLEARDKVKDTTVNYDRVSNAVKQLRMVPFASDFPSFAYEAMRTSVGILRTGFNEVSTGNPVLVERGLRRIAAFGIVGGGLSEGMSYGASKLAGLRDDQIESLQVTTKTPYSQVPIVIPVRDSQTGDLYVGDASSWDPYETVRRPLKRAVVEIAKGAKDKDKVADYIVRGTLDGFKELVAPYTTDSMTAEAMDTLWSAFKSEDGVATNGKRVFSKGMTQMEKASAVSDVMWDVIGPQTLTTISKAYDEATNLRKKYSGKETTPGTASVNILGVNFSKLDLEEKLKLAASSYAKFKRGLSIVSPNYRTTAEELLDKYDQINRDYYDAQRELYDQTFSKQNLGMSAYSTQKTLADSGLTSEERWAAMNGQFRPYEITPDVLKNIREKMYFTGNTQKISYWELMDQLAKRRNAMFGTSLDKFDTDSKRPMDKQALDILREGK